MDFLYDAVRRARNLADWRLVFLATLRGFGIWKGHGQMITGGSCTEYAAVWDGQADANAKRSGVHRGKKLILTSARRAARPQILLLLAASFAMTGCGLVGANSGTSQNQTPTISISLMQAPPSTLAVAGTAPVSATVSDDVANAGVDWRAMCGSVNFCGSFSPTHTASGAATTFTAPVGVPAGGTVSVIALSTTDKSKALATTVAIVSTVTDVKFTLLPPSSFPSGASVPVAATVDGDPAGLGVDWKASCGGIDCTASGFPVPHSDPGTPDLFDIPLPSASYPAIVGSVVTLTAFATADHSFSASVTFTVAAPISINITQPPPSTVPTNASVPIVATVTDDPTNSGVTWSVVSCDASPCGSWSATSDVRQTQAASGATVTYTAPPTPVNHVILKAAATVGPVTFTTVEISITAVISVTITQGPPNNTIAQNASAPVIATVSDDSANGGVDWTATCGSPGACGSFAPTHTANGVATIFTAPPAVPAGNTVTIVATSTSDKTKSGSQTVTVTQNIPPTSLLLGQWIMLLTGKNANGGAYVLGGEISGDGLGTITGATVDLADLGGGSGFNAGTVTLAAAPKSTYSIGTDGRGQINLTLNTGNGNLNGSFGVNGSGSIALSVVFVTGKHALISESDAFGSGTGTLDLQSASDLAAFRSGTSGLSGNYTLNLAGVDVAGTSLPYFLAGAVSFRNSSGSYTETSYITDQSDQGVIHSAPYTSVSVPFAGAAPFPTGQISLLGVNLGVPPNQFSLDFWLIDANHFVVTDTRDLFFLTPSVLIGGYMVAQPATPAISGTYAFTETAETASPAFNPQPAGGIFTCGSTGTLDATPLGGTSVTGTINAACGSPVHGRGTITFSGAGTTGTKISQFAAYPTVDQALNIIELDGGAAGSSGPSGSGVARSVSLVAPTPGDFSGKYAGNFLASTPIGLEGFAGQVVSDGVSILSGVADVNSFNATAPALGTPSLATVLSGSFTAPNTGRFPLALKITPATGQPTPELTNINPVCYIVDSITPVAGGATFANTCLLLGTDANAAGTGILEFQNTGL